MGLAQGSGVGLATPSAWLALACVGASVACSPYTGGLGEGDAAAEAGEAGIGGSEATGGEAGEGDDADTGTDTGTSGDGDGDASGDGDGDGDTSGDGDASGDGDGDPLAPVCGNGEVEAPELCDDGNGIAGDGCDTDCSPTEILQLAAGGRHTCALIEGGRVRCWGEGSLGATGHGDELDIGDDEVAGVAADVELGGVAVAIAAGEQHSCARLDDGSVRCWGAAAIGQLGNGSTELLGDDEAVVSGLAAGLGGAVAEIAVGGAHSCGRLASGVVRCWGRNDDGQLGLGGTEDVGDDELPSSLDPVVLGADALRVAAGGAHSCAITAELTVLCWGRGSRGQLGYGDSATIANQAGETPASVGAVDLAPAALPELADVAELALGLDHSCARFDSGEVLCWGRNDHGQLGQGPGAIAGQDWGDDADEVPAALTPISLGGPAVALAAGHHHSCALLDDGSVRCWGRNDRGQLGLGVGGGALAAIGDDELPSEVAAVEIGGAARTIAAGAEHVCVVRDDDRVLCWGNNAEGRLGYGHTEIVGDNEIPAAAGPVDLL